jgi:2-C-methyl-D-erythritol 4-phosphate cytidylyltransferase/2-C-methyl-D-erythritol 2,4-cyclodiphosphate synthase
MSVAAILLAAGSGERLGASVPKAFVELDGRSLLEHVVLTLHDHDPPLGILVVVPGDIDDRLTPGAFRATDQDMVISKTGGPTRQASVASGLEAVADLWRPDIVICHDVARPLAPRWLFADVLAAVKDADGAVPAIPVTDTIKRVDDDRVTETLERDQLVAVQTPQAFRFEALRDAHERAERDGVEATDDAALLERAGYRVVIVPGDPHNIKITRPEDLRMASFLRGLDD